MKQQFGVKCGKIETLKGAFNCVAFSWEAQIKLTEPVVNNTSTYLL